MVKFKVHKLVRDNINMDICRGIKILEENDFKQALKAKLIEESTEILHAKTNEELVEELADLYEVIDALIKIYHLSPSHIKSIQKHKFDKRGGFSKRAFVEYAEVNEHSPCMDYFKGKQDVYPEITEEVLLT